jgi:hypothetical protein
MDQVEAQALFRKFAAPLAGYAATSAQRKEGAEFMARTLWAALLAGPAMEEATWNVFKTTARLDDHSLQTIKDLYFQQMKPVVTQGQLAELRQRYLHRREA